MKKFFIIFLLFFILLANRVNALDSLQTQTSLSVNPAILETVLSSNDPLVKEITLTNLSNSALPIKTIKQAFSPSEKVLLTEEEYEIYDASSWIQISPEDSDFILQPFESKVITLNITKPEKASPGAHYATIYFQPLIPQELISTDSIFVYSRVAVIVFMQVPGDIVQKIGFGEIKYDQVVNPGKFNLNFNLENLGNTHIEPSGKINIYDKNTGELIKTLPIKTSLLLPKILKPISNELDLPNIGIYSIEIIYTYGANSEIISSGIFDIIVFPYTFSVFIIIPVFIIGFFVIKRRRKIKLAFKALTSQDKPINDPAIQA